MLQKELAKCLNTRYKTEMDDKVLPEASSDGISLSSKIQRQLRH